MEIYVTAQRWTENLLAGVRERGMTGVTLGDLFCQKRMFANEWFDVPDFARMAREQGLRVIFQTPVYNTARSIEPTLSLIRKLVAAGLLDVVLVHDIGVLNELSSLPVERWWDRFAFNRDFVPNAYLVDFLSRQNVSRIEVLRPAHIKPVVEAGCSVLLYSYGPEIASFGRVCYTEYFMDEPCERQILCSRPNSYIASVDKVPLQYTADGYFLIDRNEPMHLLPELTAEHERQVSGLTVYIRNMAELDALLPLTARFETRRNGGQPA
jgi:hypothetical protein